MRLIRTAAPLLALLLPAAALAQTTPVPVTPSTCPVTAVAVGGTAVTAFSGPANGFRLGNPIGAAGPLFYSISGTAASTEGGGTFALAAGTYTTFDGQLAGGSALSVNAAAAQPFDCTRW